MKIKLWVLSFLITSFICSSPCSAVPGFGDADFSAEMVMKTGSEQIQGAILVSGEKIRMQIPMGTMIIRRDKNVSWMIMQEQKMYMEQAIDPRHTPKTSKEMPGEVERVPMGEESVNGKPAKKFKVTYVENGNQASAYQWISDQFPIPVKMESLDGSWSVEYQDIKMGKQPDILFEIPEGYQKFAVPNMGDLLQGFAGQGNE